MFSCQSRLTYYTQRTKTQEPIDANVNRTASAWGMARGGVAAEVSSAGCRSHLSTLDLHFTSQRCMAGRVEQSESSFTIQKHDDIRFSLRSQCLNQKVLFGPWLRIAS